MREELSRAACVVYGRAAGETRTWRRHGRQRLEASPAWMVRGPGGSLPSMARNVCAQLPHEVELQSVSF